VVDIGTHWFPPLLVRLIRNIHDGSMASVGINGGLSEPFALNCGLKQGSVFAPMLFNIFFGAIIGEFHKRLAAHGVKISYRIDGQVLNPQQLQAVTKAKGITIREALFADDAKMVATSSL
jgi:hypothetical protein